MTAPRPTSVDIRASYNAVARAYADKFFDELSHKPFDRALLDEFATATARRGRVLDVGTGPGQVAHYLSEDGVNVAGSDLSPAMVDVARELSPRIPFRVGDMRQIDEPDGALTGLTAFYSLIHLPRAEVPTALAEFRRVLAVGGRLLIAVHGGSGTVHRDEFLGSDVPFDASLFSLGEIVSLVEASGFWVDSAHQRRPYDFEHPTPRIYVTAHAINLAEGALQIQR